MSEKYVTAKIAWAIERWWSEKTATQAELLDRIDAIIRERDQQVALSVLDSLAELRAHGEPDIDSRMALRRRITAGEWKPPHP